MMLQSVRKALSLLLCAALLFGLTPLAYAENEPTGGMCGNNLQWNFDQMTAVLTINGFGDMDHYQQFNDNGNAVTSAPWQPFCQMIGFVEISDGVTSVGNNAFFGCVNLHRVTLPASVMQIGDFAFSGCLHTPIELYYGGQQSGWETLLNTPGAIGAGNGDLLNAIKSFLGTAIHGSCGENVTWFYEEGNHTLIISGFGEMNDYSAALYYNSLVTTAPWRTYYQSIESVRIDRDVMRIGSYAFFGCSALEIVFMDENLMNVGD